MERLWGPDKESDRTWLGKWEACMEEVISEWD